MQTVERARSVRFALIAFCFVAGTYSRALEQMTPQSRSESLLESDTRLRVKVTLRRDRTNVVKTLQSLSDTTKVSLDAKGSEVRPYSLFCRFEKTPLKNILSSLTYLRNWQWELQEPKQWLLFERENAAMNAFFQPHSDVEAQLYREGRNVVDALGDLSREERSALLEPVTGGHYSAEGLSANSFSAEAQQSLRHLLDLQRQMNEEAGLPTTEIASDG